MVDREIVSIMFHFTIPNIKAKFRPSYDIYFEAWLVSSYTPGLVLVLRPANERRRYKVTPSLIGWAHT